MIFILVCLPTNGTKQKHVLYLKHQRDYLLSPTLRCTSLQCQADTNGNKEKHRNIFNRMLLNIKYSKMYQ